MTKGGKQTVEWVPKKNITTKKVSPTKDIKFLLWLFGYTARPRPTDDETKNKFKLKEITSFVKISV